SLVERAEKLALGLQFDERGGEQLARSQASKAVEVAGEAETPRVFLNWAHYQAGRREAERFWKCPLAGGGTLVQRLGQELTWIDQEVAKQVPDRARRLPTTRKASALLLGYLRRALIGLAALRQHQESTAAPTPAPGGKR